MAILYITEYQRVASNDFGGGIQAPLEPPIDEQTVAIGATSVQSETLNSATRLVRLHTDAACHLAIGINPTATTSNRRMIADSTEFIGIPNGNDYKIAVIQE